MSYCVNGFRADSCHNRAPFVLVAMIALLMGPVFIYLFQKLSNFCGQICDSGSISVRFRFTKILPRERVVQPIAHLSLISVMLQAIDEKVFKMKVLW